MGLGLYEMTAQHIPTEPRELESLIRLWQREAVLSGCAVFVACDDPETFDTARSATVGAFVEAVTSPLIVAGELPSTRFTRPIVLVEVPALTTDDRRTLWLNALGDAASSLNGDLDAMILQHRLSASSIGAIASEALHRSRTEFGNDRPAREPIRGILAESCRVRGRSNLARLAQRIEPVARWEDIVLPAPQVTMLREIAVHVRRRLNVYEQWGFGRRYSRGLGISSLFAGPSGTGKTMAAEVLAGDLGLDLFRIDLSQVVSKYIGETEKNLRRVFDAAEEGAAILLFDEADALFGKRSEVKDSHDRYANIEISYLLQRMEAYHGLAILTTNMKTALDSAFLRRIRFIVEFPFPDLEDRREIWRRVFPSETPVGALDYDRLARLNLAGGSIFNIAVNAAFRAAEDGRPVHMTHLADAVRSEYTKLQKPLPQTEMRGWV